jgi:hypothetical protein
MPAYTGMLHAQRYSGKLGFLRVELSVSIGILKQVLGFCLLLLRVDILNCSATNHQSAPKKLIST